MEPELRSLTHQVQAQARLIEALRSRSPFGFFQRRRLRKMQRVEEVATYLREDALRSQLIELKAKLRARSD